MQSWKSPVQRNILALSRIKINNVCQEINQEVYKLLVDALHATGPEKFLDAKFHFYFKQRPKMMAIDSDDFDAGIEENQNGLNATFSGTVEVIPMERDSIFQLQEGGNYETASETFDGSQGSCNSLSSVDSLHRENGAPVVSRAKHSVSDIYAASPDPTILNSSILPPIDASLKRSHRRAFGKPSRGKRPSGKYDPENHEIMRLRQEEDLDFQEIADRLNEARSRNGSNGDLTDNAVYSRYTRNAPLIAQLKNEKFVPTAKDNHYTKMKFPKADPISGFDAEEDSLLEMAEKQIEEQFWTLVSKRIEELGGGPHNPEVCERRFDCL